MIENWRYYNSDNGQIVGFDEYSEVPDKCVSLYFVNQMVPTELWQMENYHGRERYCRVEFTADELNGKKPLQEIREGLFDGTKPMRLKSIQLPRKAVEKMNLYLERLKKEDGIDLMAYGAEAR